VVVDTERAVQNTIRILQRISEYPQAVLKVLNPAERDKLMMDLSMLVERSAGLEDEADLLFVTETLQRLVKDTPALAELLLPQNGKATAAQERPTTRKISFQQDKDAYEKYERMRYARTRATEIRNHVVTAYQELRILRERSEEQ
jgi:hypothetical protein